MEWIMGFRDRLEDLEREGTPIRVGLPISVARAAIYGEPTIACSPSPTSEVVAKRNLKAGEKLGSIGSADYHGWLYAASDARDMLPLGLASGGPNNAERLPRSGHTEVGGGVGAGLVCGEPETPARDVTGQGSIRMPWLGVVQNLARRET